ncbi:MAG TPA: FAD-binding protein [Rhizomicrobium sp.]|nr:FAD-binding protein [Rhizomicrobium sp.]
MIAESEAQVVEAVRAARAAGTPFEIVGGDTRRGFGRPTEPRELLDVSRLEGVVAYEPEELILTVRPGTALAEIETLLAAKGQRLGFDPCDWSKMLGNRGTATIGGAVSTDACGSAAIRYGRARDHLLGIRAVNGFGEAFKAGGRVVKNVTGFDIPKLVCGAMGTLCVLTELTFRVFPKPPEARCFALRGIAPTRGLRVLKRAWSSPLDATGLGYLPYPAVEHFPEIGNSGHGAAIFRIEGTQVALAEKSRILRDIAPGVEALDSDPFPRIGSGEIFAGTLLDITRAVLTPAPRQPSPYGDDYEPPLKEEDWSLWIADWAGQLIWRASTPGVTSGCATLLRASAETRKRAHVFPPEEPARAALTRAVKAAFDPLGLFNPGRMYKDV